MSDLLVRLKRCLDVGIGCNVCVNELPEAITALQALRDLETLFEGKNRYTEIRKQNLNDSNCFSVQVGPQIKLGGYQDTIPAALRAAVEAIQKGETE